MPDQPSVDHGPPPAPLSVRARLRARFRLAARLFSGVLATGLCYAGWWTDARLGAGWITAALVALVALACAREFFRFLELLELDGRPLEAKPFRGLAYVCVAALPLATEWDCLRFGAGAPWDFGLAETALSATLLGACLAQLLRRATAGALVNVSFTLLTVGYCAWLPSFIVRLRHLELPGAAAGMGWEYQGVEFVVMGIFLAKVSDTGALLIGGKYGRHKLIPRLSPGKTWEGALGGLLFSAGFMALCAALHPLTALRALGWGGMLGLAVLMWLAALAGDLVESAFKRDCRTKDAGGSVPGFGGMLDLVDSLLLAAPALYLYLRLCGAVAA